MKFSCPGCHTSYLFMIDPESAGIVEGECVCKMLQKLEAELIGLKLRGRRTVSHAEVQRALEKADLLIENAELVHAIEWVHKCLLLNGMDWKAFDLRDKLKVSKFLKKRLEAEAKDF